MKEREEGKWEREGREEEVEVRKDDKDGQLDHKFDVHVHISG